MNDSNRWLLPGSLILIPALIVGGWCFFGMEAGDFGIGDNSTASLDGSDQKISYSRVRGDGLPPRAPNPWFFAKRAFPFGKIPIAQWRQAQRQARRAKDWAAQRPQPVRLRRHVVVVVERARHPLRDEDLVHGGVRQAGADDVGHGVAQVGDHQRQVRPSVVVVECCRGQAIATVATGVRWGWGSLWLCGCGFLRRQCQG